MTATQWNWKISSVSYSTDNFKIQSDKRPMILQSNIFTVEKRISICLFFVRLSRSSDSRVLNVSFVTLMCLKRLFMQYYKSGNDIVCTNTGQFALPYSTLVPNEMTYKIKYKHWNSVHRFKWHKWNRLWFCFRSYKPHTNLIISLRTRIFSIFAWYFQFVKVCDFRWTEFIRLKLNRTVFAL